MNALSTLHSHSGEKNAACQQAHVLRTRHWEGNNLWSPHPVLEAQLLDMQTGQWPQLEALLRDLLQAVALPQAVCECQPQSNGRGLVIVQASEAALGRVVVHQALELLGCPEAVRAKGWELALARIRKVEDEECLGPSTACIVQAAQARHLPAYRLFPRGNLVQLGMGAAQQRIWTAESDQTSAIAQDIAANKALTKRLLAQAGIPTPQGDVAATPTHAWHLAQQLGVPVVVKPLDGNRARGVSLDLMDQESVEAAWYLAKNEGSQVLVERCVRGHEHRLLVVGNRLVAASRGEALCVWGNGIDNVSALVEAQINQHARCLVDMTVERIELAHNQKVRVELLRQQLQPASIPAAGQQVMLSRTGNHTEDCTDDVHPEVAAYAVMAARTIGLDIAGMDLVVQDISQPLLVQEGAFVEVNAGPSLLMHLRPVKGTPRPVGLRICEQLFPTEESGRVPVTGVLAAEAACLHMGQRLAYWQQQMGYCVGLAAGREMFVQQKRMLQAGAASPATQRVLMHRAVSAAVLAQTVQQAEQVGWAYAQCDAAIIAAEDVPPNDMTGMRILAAQLRTVRSGGVAVLTAGCKQLESLALTCLGRVVWVDADGQHPVLQAHRRVGGRVVFVQHGHIVCAEGQEELHLPLPASMEPDACHEWLCVAATGWAMEWPLHLWPDVLTHHVSVVEEPAVTAWQRRN